MGKKHKKTKHTDESNQLLAYRHPLARNYKRGKVRREVVQTVVQTRNSSALGEIWENLMGAGYLAISLKLLFFADTPDMIALRKRLAADGFKHRPKPIHIDAFAIIEKSYPDVISKAELAAELDVSEHIADSIVTYLKRFIAEMYGISVLPDWEGNVGLASPELWLTWQNRMAAFEGAIRKARVEQGMNDENVKNLRLEVKTKLPRSQPIIFEQPDKAGNDHE